MKKLNFALLLAHALSAVLVSCGGGGGGGGGGSAPATTTDSSNTNTATTSTTTSTPTYFGTKSPTDSKALNDIVFNDGSATPYTSGLSLTDSQKNAAVAVIFYKDSTKTLGVGLKRSASTIEWCLDTANGFNKNIDTIQCTPSGSPGAYTFSGDTDGSNNLAQIATYLTSHGSTDDTGTAGNYPAFEYAKNYGSTNGCTGAYATGWYLPSIAELYQIYNLRANIDAAVALCGLTNTFSNGLFWSSSQYASLDDFAYRFTFDYYGSFYDDSKEGDFTVCAVRAF